MNAALDEIVKDKTVLVIAHRLSTIKNADKICVMKEGKCIAADTHGKLIDSCSEYRKLWDASVSAMGLFKNMVKKKLLHGGSCCGEH